MSDKSATVHNESIIIDGLFCHMDQPIPPTEQAPGFMLEHILASGVTAFGNSVIADSFPVSMSGALTTLYKYNALFEVFPDQLQAIHTTADLRKAKQNNRVGMILSTQGLNCIGEDIRNLWVLYKLGIRIMQLTYNEHNSLGSGCMEPNDHGLTRRGQQAIEHMSGLGAVLDLSHAGERTSLEAIAYAGKPPIFSHVAVKHFNKHNRAISDDQIRAIADKGGVVGLCPHSVFIERERGKRPTIDDYLAQIAYVVDLVGIDHVGVGTDNLQTDNFYTRWGRAMFARTLPNFFGGYSADEKHAEGFSRWSDWPNLTKSLLDHGFSEEDTKKVLGANFQRVFEQNWDVTR